MKKYINQFSSQIPSHFTPKIKTKIKIKKMILLIWIPLKIVYVKLTLINSNNLSIFIS